VAPSTLRFAATEDSQRNMVKGGAWAEAEEMAYIKTFKIASEDTEKGVSQQRADFMNAVFTGSSASLDWIIIRRVASLPYGPLALPIQYSRGTRCLRPTA
jgi:hypothetical protein